MSSADSSRRAVLYDVILPGTTRREAEERLAESEQLLTTFGGVLLLKVIQRRNHTGSRSFIGLAKLEEVVTEMQNLGANLLVINAPLKPRQIYAIEAVLEEKKINERNRQRIHVWDRVDLILMIFEKHARTAEARLQIELARIRHQGPRIFGMGTDLSNQGGGIGTRGLGETNTEIMRRHLAERIHKVQQKLDRLEKGRAGHHKRRDRLGFRQIALVGYTNAGKSALFKALTGKDVLVRDALFATLDPSTARIRSDLGAGAWVLSDTIGFIQDLPLDLVAAFGSTLQEAFEADLLLHVIDQSDPRAREKIDVVDEILRDIGMDGIPVLRVLNKCDLDDGGLVSPGRRVSAVARTGLRELLADIREILQGVPLARKPGLGAPEALTVEISLAPPDELLPVENAENDPEDPRDETLRT